MVSSGSARACLRHTSPGFAFRVCFLCRDFFFLNIYFCAWVFFWFQNSCHLPLLSQCDRGPYSCPMALPSLQPLPLGVWKILVPGGQEQEPANAVCPRLRVTEISSASRGLPTSLEPGPLPTTAPLTKTGCFPCFKVFLFCPCLHLSLSASQSLCLSQPVSVHLSVCLSQSLPPVSHVSVSLSTSPCLCVCISCSVSLNLSLSLSLSLPLFPLIFCAFSCSHCLDSQLLDPFPS